MIFGNFAKKLINRRGYQKYMKKVMLGKKMKYIVCVFMVLLACVSVVQGCRNAMAYPMGSFDFQYDSAKYIAMRIDPYEETLNPTGMQEKLGLDVFYGPLEANQFASVLVMLIPFTFFEPMTANCIFLIFNLICTLGCFVLIKKLFFSENNNIFTNICIGAFFLIGTPWRNNVGNGQHTIFSFFFFLLCLYFSERKQWFESGISLAIAFFKYTLTVPMALYLIYKRKIKELAVSVIIHIVFLFMSSIWLRKPMIEMIVDPLKKSVGLAQHGSYDIGATFDLGQYGMLITIVLLLGLFVYMLFGKFKGTDEEMLSLLTMFSLIIVYHRIYDYFVLIIPLIVVLKYNDNNIFQYISKMLIYLIIMYVFVGQKIITVLFPEIIAKMDYLYALIYYFTIMFWFFEILKRKD